MRSQQFGVNDDLDRPLLPTQRRGRNHTIDRLKLGPDLLLGEVAQPVQITGAEHLERHDCTGQDRRVEALHGERRLLRKRGQQLAHASVNLQFGDPHIGRRLVRNRYPAVGKARLRVDLHYVLELAYLLFDRHHDLTLDLLRRHRALVSNNEDLWEDDLGHQLDAKSTERNHAEHADRDKKHPRGDGSADGKIGDHAGSVVLSSSGNLRTRSTIS